MSETDLRYFTGLTPGYYQATWVDKWGHVCGWIPKPFGNHVDKISDIPEEWVSPPFFAALWDLDDVEVLASSLKDLQEIQAAIPIKVS